MSNIYIGSARHDERGKYSGGRRGDQTKDGSEVSTQKMYNYPSKGGWIAYRAKNPVIAIKLRDAMLAFCSNNNYGYSQSDRYNVIGKGTNASTPTNGDCSSYVREAIRVATGTDIGDFNTASEHSALMNSGLFTKIGAVTTLSSLYEGDILVTRLKGHTAIVTSGVSYPVTNTVPQVVTNRDAIIAAGQQHSINFTGHQIKVDGVRGSETREQAVRVVQKALCLDYGAKIQVDGVWGDATNKAFGSHYVKKGETQYLVTAAEILCMLDGKDPNGVECPGKFGNGLASAAGSTKIARNWFNSKTK